MMWNGDALETVPEIKAKPKRYKAHRSKTIWGGAAVIAAHALGEYFPVLKPAVVAAESIGALIGLIGARSAIAKNGTGK